MARATKGTKEGKLFCWMRTKTYILTSDIFRYGVQNCFTSAVRRARTVAEEGRIIRRFTKEELSKLNYNGRERIYYVLGKQEEALSDLNKRYGTKPKV